MNNIAPTASPPSITSLTPNAGPATGGATVSIIGKNFNGATKVNFGAVTAAGFTLVSDTTITAITPAQAVGVVQVTVITPNGGTSAGVPYTGQTPPANVATATIQAGQSLSQAVNLTQNFVAVIIAPPNWTDAYLSFEVSLDNVIWGIPN